MENEAPTYGEPASLALELSRNIFKVGEYAIAAGIVKDNAGHYLLDNKCTLAVDNTNFAVEGTKIIAKDRGIANVTATYGELTTSAEITCATTADAVDLTTLEGVTYTATSGNVDMVFDKNEGSQIEWNCSESEEHGVTVNLGKNMYIQAIELVWEGASATHYTVTLSADAEPEVEPVNRRVSSYSNNVFTVEDGAGGAGVTARELLHTDDFSPVKASTVTLATSKAFDPGWGMKLKEMYIHGNEYGQTGGVGIEDIDVEAPVEYYNLQGVRVNAENVPAGLYIRRQGNIATKVMIK